MPIKKMQNAPDDKRPKRLNRRAPDRRIDSTQFEDSTKGAAPQDTRYLRSRIDPLGRVRVTVGFELVSCATPPRVHKYSTYGGEATFFAGEPELANDIRVALAPFMAEMPEGAALVADYLFAPVGEGSVEVRFRLLVESAPGAFIDAHEQALTLRDELAVCLRVVADWYTFAPVDFSPADRTRWLGQKVHLRAQPRLFAMASTGHIGFASPEDAAGTPQLILAQPAAGVAHGDGGQREDRALLLHSTGRCCLVASIRAARGLTVELPVRIGLRRRNMDPAVLQSLLPIAAKLSAAAHGEVPGGLHPSVTGIAGTVAHGAIVQLVTQPECLEVFVESAGPASQSRAWLRILGQELFPAFACEVVDGPPPSQRRRGRTKKAPIDLSQLLTPGSVAPPLLPAPPQLEALSFPRHFPNPTVTFAGDGLHLGRAKIGGVVVDVRMPHHDRSRHTYALGATGTGKSVLLYNMAVQDMQLGHGFVVIDPHGDLYDQLIAAVPPERKRDLVLIDPDDDRFCPGLNPLDFDGKPDMLVASRAASDMLDVFDELYDMRTVAGPMFEEYFRNSLLLAVAGQRGGPLESDGPIPTLASIVHVLRDRTWREQCISRLDSVYGKDAAAPVHQFFKTAQATTGDHSFTNHVPYVSVKLTRFTTNATLRRLFCAGRRTVDFRQLIDDRKIVLVNLSKGDLGGPDSRIIGMLLTKYFFHAALSRSDIAREARTPFYFYLDEFQNFVATDIPEMLAEARKYGLHMVLANQTLGQLTKAGNRETLDAVLGNVATKLFLRVGQQEASTLEAGFAPYFDAQTLTQLPDRHVLCRLQSKGQPTLPFVFETLPPAPLPHGASTARALSWAAENLSAEVSGDNGIRSEPPSKSAATVSVEAAAPAIAKASELAPQASPAVGSGG